MGVIGRREVFEKKAKAKVKRPPQSLANVPSVWLRLPHRHSTSLSPGVVQLFVTIRCTLEDPLSHHRRRPCADEAGMHMLMSMTRKVQAADSGMHAQHSAA